MAAATSEEGREIRELKERLSKAEMMVSEVLEDAEKELENLKHEFNKQKGCVV